MRQRTILYVLLGLAALFVGLGLPAAALAGGWSVVTLDKGPPDALEVDRSFNIEFTVRQHGVRPINGLSPTIRLTHRPSGEQVVATAKDTGKDGRYTAALRLPQAGHWDWEIEAFGPVAKLTPLQVVAALPAPADAPAALAPGTQLWPAQQPWLLLALAVAASAGALLARRRRTLP